AMDTQLRTVISAVKNIRNAVPNSDDYYTAQTSVFNAVGEMIFGAEDADSKHKSILQELTSHSTKQSVMRDTLLAKRITHSGRSVISVNPKLKLGEAGIPISIASKILESFAVVELVNNSHLYPELTKLYTDDINNLVAVN